MFPGQGSQHKGMGEELFKEFPEAVEIANHALGYNIVDLCLTDSNNQLNQTNYTQPALFFVNYLYYQKHIQTNLKPDYLIGHSLGEFNALNAAGVFDLETGLKIVQKRGELMFSISGTSMAAVVGADYKEIKDILKNNFPDIDIANINTSSQIVISGKADSLETAADFFDEEGLVYIPLKVSGAFHSRYMSPVKAEFQQFIEKLEMHKCQVPVISNYSGSTYPLDKEGIIKNIVNQINSPVKWLQSVEYLMYQGDCSFLEIGSSDVLTNMVKKIKI